MRTLLSIAALLSLSAPVFANPAFPVPEPETLGLLAIAAVGMALVRRIKK